MARGYPSQPEYREIRQKDLGGGLNDRRNQATLDDSETPACLNVDFDTESVRTTGGAIKFGNEPAPGGAVRTRATLAPLYVAAQSLQGTATAHAIEVPQRGAVYLPYSEAHDIGGRFDYEGDPLASATYHNRRGTSFEVNVSFQIPPDEKLYEAPSNGAGYVAPSLPFIPPHGFDEALDECVCVLQKGGDRTAPMSWALAIVNIGAGTNITNIPTQRPSNYCLAWIWYDAPQWGDQSTTTMKYNLTTAQSPVSGPNATFCTQAYRTILIGKFLEPGIDYSVSVQLSMDTGSPGGVSDDTDWSNNGAFKVFLWENRRTWWYATALNTGAGVITQSSSETGTPARLEVVRGPTDSLEYLCKYGVRYAGRDAMFVGLGQRFTPWMACGFIPFGSDCTPLRYGGFSMVDRSTTTAATLYGGGVYTLTAAHTSGDAYVVMNHQGLVQGNTNGGWDPKVASASTFWEGLGTNRNAEAIRGYKLVTLADWASGRRGGIMQILSYSESGASYRLTIHDGANTAAFGTFSAEEVLVQCWRWHQRDLIVGQVSVSFTPTNYIDSVLPIAASRAKLGLRMSHAVGDATDPRLASLAAYWPLDDAGEPYFRELMSGGMRAGYRIPFGNGVGPGGTRGENLVFLSGEGEALTLNLSEDETFVREMTRMLAGYSQGFAIELTCVFTEAFYALQTDVTLTNESNVTLTGAQPVFVPIIASLDIEEQDTASASGVANEVRPLMRVGFREALRSSDSNPFKYPCGLGASFALGGDGEERGMVQPSAIQPWYVDGSTTPHNRYSLDAPWVGKTVTIQVGIQRSTTAGTFNAYVALMPKAAFYPQSGDASNVEMQYWTDSAANTSADGAYAGTSYYQVAQVEIAPKDFARAVLTIGGGWRAKERNASTSAYGVHDLNARMLIDEVRWFVAPAPGSLGTYAAQVATLTARNGKLEGTNCLPPRLLSAEDMLQPLGANVRSVSVQQNLASVSPPSGGSFYTADPWTTLQAVEGCYLRLVMDDEFVAREEELGGFKRSYQYVLSATDSTLTLAAPYTGLGRTNAEAGAFRLGGYTAFQDDVRDRPLLLGRGGGYGKASDTEDVQETDERWGNVAVPGGGFGLRVYSPLGALGSEELLPSWTRGMVYERRLAEDGVLGLYGWNGIVYAGVRGALYEADDRWRDDGPSDSLPLSLAFRNRAYLAGLSGPLQGDSVLYDDTSKARIVVSSTDAYAYVFDVWVKLSEIRNYQTVLWLGALSTDSAQLAGTSANKIQYWWRFNNGRPELVLGSTATYDGSNRPEKGLFVAQGATAIQAGEWTHVRITLPSASSGANVRVPYMQINGKSIGVTVNARANGLSGTNWITAASLVTAGSTPSTSILVGAARDSYRAPEPTLTWVNGVVGQPLQVSPQRIQGLLHSLGGRVALCAVTRQPWSGSAPSNFDPYTVSYDVGGIFTAFFLDVQSLGVGHKVQDIATQIYGPIYSSPFVSVFHEMGTSKNPYAFAEYGSQMYATNGGRPVVVFPEVSRA